MFNFIYPARTMRKITKVEILSEKELNKEIRLTLKNMF